MRRAVLFLLGLALGAAATADLPPSGTISINDLATEFGGSAPHALNEYYRGGALVPDTAQNASVPTSGAISLSNFYGTSADSWVVSFDVPNIGGTTTPPGSAGVVVTFYGNDGAVPGSWIAQATSPSGPGQVGDTWITDAPVDLTDFQIRFTLLSGVTPSGTLNTWMSLSTSRTISINSNFGQGTRSSTIRIEIRYQSGSVLHTDTTVISATA